MKDASNRNFDVKNDYEDVNLDMLFQLALCNTVMPQKK